MLPLLVVQTLTLTPVLPLFVAQTLTLTPVLPLLVVQTLTLTPVLPLFVVQTLTLNPPQPDPLNELETNSVILTTMTCATNPSNLSCSVDVTSVFPSNPCGNCFAVYPCGFGEWSIYPCGPGEWYTENVYLPLRPR